ncbi:hypothetical protein Dimus_003527, partial [Dionaea muscipula]
MEKKMTALVLVDHGGQVAGGAGRRPWRCAAIEMGEMVAMEVCGHGDGRDGGDGGSRPVVWLVGAWAAAMVV